MLKGGNARVTGTFYHFAIDDQSTCSSQLELIKSRRIETIEWVSKKNGDEGLIKSISRHHSSGNGLGELSIDTGCARGPAIQRVLGILSR